MKPAPRFDRLLGLILLVGLVARLLFVFAGAKFYYPTEHATWYNGDTHSFIWTWENLWLHGRYTFDFLEPDAAFGRLPGYPFFYGLHYLLFGAAHAVRATQISQALLDTVAIGLVAGIVRRLAPQSGWAPYVGAALYAFYPFAIVWITIIGTESLATFLSILWVYVVLSRAGGRWHVVVVGVLIAYMFYVREYLGICLPITGAWWLWRAWQGRSQDSVAGAFRMGVLTGVTFLALYIWWPIRNYVSFHRFVPVKTMRAGYANYNIDLDSFRAWVSAWSNDTNEYLEQITYDEQPEYPDAIFASPAEKAEALRLSALAKRCGSSFYIYKEGFYGSDRYRDTAIMQADPHLRTTCNAEISTGFDALKKAYIQRHPVKYWLDVPGQNIWKAFFKTKTSKKLKRQAATGGKAGMIVNVLFAYRSLLVILGFVGMALYRRRYGMFPLAALTLFMYLFICFIVRALEMRYLLQADCLLLLPAAILLGERVFDRLLKRPVPAAGAASV